MIYRLRILLCLLLLATPALAQTTERPLQVLHALGCKSCHRFQGQGGRFARPLGLPGEAIGALRLSRQLARPAATSGPIRMPAYLGITAEQLRALTQLLAARPHL